MHEVDNPEERSAYNIGRNRFVVLIVGTIVIALILVFVSLGLYAASGAAQLDLSRPDYKSIRDQIGENGEYVRAFPSTGPVNDQMIDEFRGLYKDAVHQATSVSVFGGETLSNSALGITAKDSSASE